MKKPDLSFNEQVINKKNEIILKKVIKNTTIEGININVKSNDVDTSGK